MPKAIDLTPEFRFMGLFIGQSGSGKTVAASSFPKPLENWDFDGRIRGILGAPWLVKEGIIYEPFPPKENGLIERINKRMESLQAMAITNQLSQQTEVLDSLTSECFAMCCQGLKLTHVSAKDASQANPKTGKYLGPIAMLGPADYGFEAQVTYDILSFFRSLPIPNVIVTAHIVDRYGKQIGTDGKPDQYSESVVIGEKLSVRDKIGANVMVYFDHVFRFEKRLIGSEERFFVQFRGDLARTSYAKLPNGEVDITGKNFYETMMNYVKQ